METKELIDQLIEMRLTAFTGELLKEGKEEIWKDKKAEDALRKAVKKLKPEIRTLLDQQLEELLNRHDKELMRVYLFGMKDGILLMQKIKKME